MNDYLNNKKVIILGFGKEGKSTYEYIRKHDKNIKLLIMDDNYQNIKLDDENVTYSKIDYRLFNDYDIIFKSPGVSFKNVDITPFKDKITSQLDYLL